ncbi:MAG TPA: hypothetical protein VJR46_02680 [Candidatus Dormibacteraeota bacterium]|nr:hypothetical protein [Candidatus Dormibacteraeota bacterium]
MLAAIVTFIVFVLVIAGVLVIVGPRNVVRRVRSLAMPTGVPPVFEPRRPRETPQAVNPRTQRVLVAAARLAAWLRAHGHEDAAREIRNALARMTGNEPAGLYALQTTLRRIRVVNVTDSASHERLQALVEELRTAVQDRFEQLELLPFRKP